MDWHSCEKLPSPRSNHNTIIIDNLLITFGGSRGNAGEAEEEKNMTELTSYHIE